MLATASPNPAAHICPARGCPGGYSAEHGSQFGIICVFGNTAGCACDCAEVTFTWITELAVPPFTSVANTSNVCAPVLNIIWASTVLKKVKNSACPSTNNRRYFTGFTSVAGATTCTGEVTLAESDGVEKHADPAEVAPGFGGGCCANSGNGATPLIGPFANWSVTAGQDALLVGAMA